MGEAIKVSDSRTLGLYPVCAGMLAKKASMAIKEPSSTVAK